MRGAHGDAIASDGRGDRDKGGGTQDPGRLARAGRLPERVADDLRQRIYASEWGAGERLPVEADLEREYGVSRATVRAAMRTLQDSGHVVVRQGIGTFVSPLSSAIRAGIQDLRSMTATIREQGHAPGVTYRSRDTRTPTAKEMEHLRIDAGTRVIALARTLSSDAVTVAFDTAVLPADLLPDDFDVSDITDSVFDVLAHHAVLPTHAVAELTASSTLGPGWEDVDTEGPYLRLEQTSYLDTGRPATLSQTYFLTDRFRFLLVRTK